jgi:hypothetical protein
VDPSIQSFVIRIWVEETAEETGEAVWRGHITHTASGERHFIRNLNEISTFIWPYLKQMGVKPPLSHKVGLRVLAALKKTNSDDRRRDL